MSASGATSNVTLCALHSDSPEGTALSSLQSGSVHAGALAPLLGPAARACGHAGTAGLPSFSLRRTTIVRISNVFRLSIHVSLGTLSRATHGRAPRPLASSVSLSVPVRLARVVFLW